MYSLCFFCFFFPIGIPPRCNALLSREVSATGADDIISDKHVFSVQVLNTSPYKVYNRWFGPGITLHLGMARECFFSFLFSFSLKLLLKRLTGINFHILGYPSYVLSCLFRHKECNRGGKKSRRQIIICTWTMTTRVKNCVANSGWISVKFKTANRAPLLRTPQLILSFYNL